MKHLLILSLILTPLCFSQAQTVKEKSKIQKAETALFKETKRLALKGDSDAQYNLGVMYYEGKEIPQNYKQSFYWYKKVALKGNVDAQYNLGVMYLKGKGVATNYKKAAYWIKKSAKQGFAKAQFALGGMHYEGVGVLRHNKQALYWIKKSAKQGFAKAQYSLGAIYYEGKRTSQNHKQAYAWASLSSSAGHKGAEKLRDELASKLSSEELTEAQELSESISDSEMTLLKIFELPQRYLHLFDYMMTVIISNKWSSYFGILILILCFVSVMSQFIVSIFQFIKRRRKKLKK